MAKENRITQDELNYMLDIFFPGGHGCSDKSDHYYAWYIGWLAVPGQGILTFPCEINLDTGGTCIVFKWYQNSDEIDNDQVVDYLLGTMRLFYKGIDISIHDKGKDMVQFKLPQDEG